MAQGTRSSRPLDHQDKLSIQKQWNLGITAEVDLPEDFDPSTASPLDDRFNTSATKPDIVEMLRQFDLKYFHGKIKGYRIEWNASLITAYGRTNFSQNKISISKFRHLGQKRSVLVKTILHQAIHAYLDKLGFNRRENAAHGKDFKAEKSRISRKVGEDIASRDDVNFAGAETYIRAHQCKKCKKILYRRTGQDPNVVKPYTKVYHDCPGVFRPIKLRETYKEP
ncbi:sprT-like domain-containing protein Spartan [Diachasma alloeum]|uniref:sprT-like domain-containing protein Spartan n=1 Tax=Diachasma alloeum TaxID=454923 RepID=UPI0007382FA3|nr:sprT-like domain-containing protein Spartan [Diachasma alloeum]XP_015117195.1 sprT-like domain-containing protein Spartan [Diachasma alloeum]